MQEAMIKHTCDSPRCDNPPQILPASQRANGYSFERGVYQYESGELVIPDTFACRHRCITPAVLSRIEQERALAEVLS